MSTDPFRRRLVQSPPAGTPREPRRTPSRLCQQAIVAFLRTKYPKLRQRWLARPPAHQPGVFWMGEPSDRAEVRQVSEFIMTRLAHLAHPTQIEILTNPLGHESQRFGVDMAEAWEKATA